jgi:hypothetical protein
MTIRVGHLYPDYLNIYADRGNIAVLVRRAELRGHELHVNAIGLDEELEPGAHDLLYVGGGQDREQALIAPDLAAKGPAIREAVAGGAAVLAVCGGYQLLGRGYRGRDGELMPGAGLFPHETVAGDARLIGDVLLECELEPGSRRTGSATTVCPGSRGVVSGARSGRTCTDRSSPGTRGLRTGWSLRRSRMRRARSHPCFRRSPTRSPRRPTEWPPSGRGPEVVAANSGGPVGHPIPPPASSVTRKGVRVVRGKCRERRRSEPIQGTHISPR